MTRQTLPPAPRAIAASVFPRRGFAAAALALSLATTLATPAFAQTVATSSFTPADVQPPTIPGVPPAGPEPMYNPAQTRQLTPHVWMMPGYPNAVIVVGKTGVLAIDTGLGTPNGRLVAAEAKRLAPGRKLYLVTTHFHPEHAAGFGGFPSDTVLIRPRVQQRELELDHGRMIARFAIDNPEVLKDPVFGTPELFDHERDIDLGGVHARAIYAGPAHTAGDTSVFIPEDSVLVTGDTIQNRFGPTFLGGGIGPAPWLATVKRLAVLKPKLIIPDHTQPGPGARIIADEEAILGEMVTRTAAAKKAGQSRQQAVASVMKTIRAERPGWNIGPLADDGVTRAYDAAK